MHSVFWLTTCIPGFPNFGRSGLTYRATHIVAQWTSGFCIIFERFISSCRWGARCWKQGTGAKLTHCWGFELPVAVAPRSLSASLEVWPQQLIRFSGKFHLRDHDLAAPISCSRFKPTLYTSLKRWPRLHTLLTGPLMSMKNHVEQGPEEHHLTCRLERRAPSKSNTQRPFPKTARCASVSHLL